MLRSVIYKDGSLPRAGDKVRMGDGLVGVVRCNFDTGEFLSEEDRVEWGFVTKGMLVETDELGPVLYGDMPKPSELEKHPEKITSVSGTKHSSAK